MAEKPIIFSTPMVRAILDGRKTQSRRVIKGDILPGWDQEWQTPCYLKIRDGKAYGNVIRTPYRPGDVLWIRETFNRMFNRIENKFDYWHKAGNDFEDDYDDSMDGDFDTGMRDAGFGTDEDYGYFGGND